MKLEIQMQMIQHCTMQLPYEACGLLSGKNGKADTIWMMQNILRSPHSFEMDTNEVKRVFHAIESRGEELVAIYHSHPTAPPYPSPFDIANANYSDVSYLIVSFMQKQPEIGCFRIVNNNVIPQSFVHLL